MMSSGTTLATIDNLGSIFSDDHDDGNDDEHALIAWSALQ